MSRKKSFKRAMEEAFSGELAVRRALLHLTAMHDPRSRWEQQVANVDARCLLAECHRAIAGEREAALREQNRVVGARKSR